MVYVNIELYRDAPNNTKRLMEYVKTHGGHVTDSITTNSFILIRADVQSDLEWKIRMLPCVKLVEPPSKCRT
jgi:hypothetical protein